MLATKRMLSFLLAMSLLSFAISDSAPHNLRRAQHQGEAEGEARGSNWLDDGDEENDRAGNIHERDDPSVASTDRREVESEERDRAASTRESDSSSVEGSNLREDDGEEGDRAGSARERHDSSAEGTHRREAAGEERDRGSRTQGTDGSAAASSGRHEAVGEERDPAASAGETDSSSVEGSNLREDDGGERDRAGSARERDGSSAAGTQRGEAEGEERDRGARTQGTDGSAAANSGRHEAVGEERDPATSAGETDSSSVEGSNLQEDEGEERDGFGTAGIRESKDEAEGEKRDGSQVASPAESGDSSASTNWREAGVGKIDGAQGANFSVVHMDLEEVEDETMPSLPLDASVSVGFTIEGLSYPMLLANQPLFMAFESVIKESIASEAGPTVTAKAVSLILSEGSVAVVATVTPLGRSVAAIVRLRERISSSSLGATVVKHVSSVENIDDVSTGTISVTRMMVRSFAEGEGWISRGSDDENDQRGGLDSRDEDDEHDTPGRSSSYDKGDEPAKDDGTMLGATLRGTDDHEHEGDGDDLFFFVVLLLVGALGAVIGAMIVLCCLLRRRWMSAEANEVVMGKVSPKLAWTESNDCKTSRVFVVGKPQFGESNNPYISEVNGVVV